MKNQDFRAYKYKSGIISYTFSHCCCTNIQFAIQFAFLIKQIAFGTALRIWQQERRSWSVFCLSTSQEGSVVIPTLQSFAEIRHSAIEMVYIYKQDCVQTTQKQGIGHEPIVRYYAERAPAYEWWLVATVTSEPFVNLETMETPSYNSISISWTEQRRQTTEPSRRTKYSERRKALRDVQRLLKESSMDRHPHISLDLICFILLKRIGTRDPWFCLRVRPLTR